MREGKRKGEIIRRGGGEGDRTGDPKTREEGKREREEVGDNPQLKKMEVKGKR